MLPNTVDDVATGTDDHREQQLGKWQPRVLAIVAVCWLLGAGTLLWLLLLATR